MYCAHKTLIIICLMHLCVSEVFHEFRDPSIGNTRVQENRNQIVTTVQCQKYLCKYGYLDCNCDVTLSRGKRQVLNNGMFPRELAHQRGIAGSASSTVAPTDLLPPRSDVSCTESHIRDALKKFQNYYKLKETGRCDTSTKNQMSLRRCGQPDNSVKTERPRSRRSKRTLTDMLRESTHLDASVTRRKEMFEEYKRSIENEVIDSNAPSRQRRSSVLHTNIQDYNGIWTKTRITWRLMPEHYSPLITPANQRAILKQAFRYWSEVSPMCFVEDSRSDYVDIEIGFLEGVHLSCVRQFDGFGGEIAHKYYRDVHFDKSEPYTTALGTSVNTDSAISLLLVSVHELGHVVGLNHTTPADSVMNAIYHKRINGRFELSDMDREEMKRVYGPCTGSFDTAFDYVRWVMNSDGMQERVFNTYFFRGNHYWMYENRPKRTRYGDPLEISPEWSGLPSNIDAFFHYQAMKLTGQKSVVDEYYFFKGDKYYMYSSGTERVVESKSINKKFKNGPNGSIPNNLDTVFYDMISKLTYFFKGQYVYTYQYNPERDHSCCVTQRQLITALYPPATPGDLASPEGNTYARDIDSIYFSYFNVTMYIIKGDDVWKNEGYNVHTPTTVPSTNSIKYIGKWSQLWNYICDGDCS